MKIKQVEKEYDRYAIEFESNGTTYWKFLRNNLSANEMQQWLQSLIDDIIIRTK